jgi:hypothetical protein
LAQCILGPLSILDIYTGCIPFKDVSLLVRAREFRGEPSRILPHRPAARVASCSYGLSVREGRCATFHHRRNVPGCIAAVHFQPDRSSNDKTNEIQPTLIEKIKLAVRQSGMNECGNCVDDEPQAIFVLAQCILSLLCVRMISRTIARILLSLSIFTCSSIGKTVPSLLFMSLFPKKAFAF